MGGAFGHFEKRRGVSGKDAERGLPGKDAERGLPEKEAKRGLPGKEVLKSDGDSFAFSTLKREGRENIFHALDRVPEYAVRVAKTLHGHRFDAYLVGGSVRNLIMDLTVTDWDFTTNASAEQIQEIFDHTVCTNNYGTVQVILDDVDGPGQVIVEITPYRKETGYSDNRRPDEVIFGVSLEEDLRRRDFTINALAYNPVTGSLIDPHNGIADLHESTIRAVGDPGERFAEDALRMMRAVRIATQMHGDIEEHTFAAIKEHADTLTAIARERIRDEFVKILMSPEPARGIFVLKETGLLKHIIPELLDGVGCEQNHAHRFDVFEHNVRVLEHAGVKELSPVLRLSALLHDISKPETRVWSEEKNDYTFYGHEVVGAETAKKILRNLKFTKETVDRVSLLVRWHMFFDDGDGDGVSRTAVRRMIARVGEDNIWDLINLRMCDRIGKGINSEEQPYSLRKFTATVEEVLREPVTPGKLMLNGTDLMRELNMRQGPRIGHLLHALLGEVLEDPAKNEREVLLALARELNNLSEGDLEKRGEQGEIRKTEENRRSVEKIRKEYGVR